jgi:hypothetical protein
VQPYVHNYAVDPKHTEDMRAVWIDAGARGGGARAAGARATSSIAYAFLRPWGRR